MRKVEVKRRGDTWREMTRVFVKVRPVDKVGMDGEKEGMLCRVWKSCKVSMEYGLG